MKKLLLLSVIVALTIGSSGCIGDPPPPEDPKETQLRLLSTTWAYKDVLNDGVRQTGYENFRLTLAGTFGASEFGYITSGRPPLSPWRSSGTWKFKEDYQSDLIRDGELEMRYAVSSDGNTIEIIFDYTGDGFSRKSGVTGVWIFTFTRGQNSM